MRATCELAWRCLKLKQVLSNLICMGKSPLILAALAKGAAPSLNIVKVQKNSMLANSDFDGALLTADDGKHYIVRIANNAAAETSQEAELRALKALTKNGSLPFAFTSQIAQNTTRDGELVRVLSYVYGSNFDLAEINADDPLVESTAKALAAIHNLPLAVVQDIDFPEYTASNILRSCAAELDRAMETGKVPSVLLNRWETALGNENLFRFMPTVINGLLSEDSVLQLDGEISGILDWMDLQIGDPARDFGWILARGHEDLVYNLLIAYQAARPSADNNIRQRAQLYSELAWASYLVSAVNNKNEDEILDAQGELEILAAQVEAGTAPRLTPTGFAPEVVATPADSAFDVSDASDFSANQPAIETAEPVFSSYNFDKPLVDFADAVAPQLADAPSLAETTAVVSEPAKPFDTTETAPIELVSNEDVKPAPNATQELPPFLTGELPDFLISEEVEPTDGNLDKDAKDDLF